MPALSTRTAGSGVYSGTQQMEDLIFSGSDIAPPLSLEEQAAAGNLNYAAAEPTAAPADTSMYSAPIEPQYQAGGANYDPGYAYPTTQMVQGYAPQGDRYGTLEARQNFGYEQAPPLPTPTPFSPAMDQRARVSEAPAQTVRSLYGPPATAPDRFGLTSYQNYGQAPRPAPGISPNPVEGFLGGLFGANTAEAKGIIQRKQGIGGGGGGLPGGGGRGPGRFPPGITAQGGVTTPGGRAAQQGPGLRPSGGISAVGRQFQPGYVAPGASPANTAATLRRTASGARFSPISTPTGVGAPGAIGAGRTLRANPVNSATVMPPRTRPQIMMPPAPPNQPLPPPPSLTQQARGLYRPPTTVPSYTSAVGAGFARNQSPIGSLARATVPRGPGFWNRRRALGLAGLGLAGGYVASQEGDEIAFNAPHRAPMPPPPPARPGFSTMPDGTRVPVNVPRTATGESAFAGPFDVAPAFTSPFADGAAGASEERIGTGPTMMLRPDGSIGEWQREDTALGETPAVHAEFPRLAVLAGDEAGNVRILDVDILDASYRAALARGEKAAALDDSEFDALLAAGLLTLPDGSPIPDADVAAWRQAVVGRRILAPTTWAPHIKDPTAAEVTFDPIAQPAAETVVADSGSSSGDSTWVDWGSGGGGRRSSGGGGYSRGSGGGGYGGYGGGGGGGGGFPGFSPDAASFLGPDFMAGFMDNFAFRDMMGGDGGQMAGGRGRRGRMRGRVGRPTRNRRSRSRGMSGGMNGAALQQQMVAGMPLNDNAAEALAAALALRERA